MGLLDNVWTTRTGVVLGVVLVLAGVVVACGGGGSPVSLTSSILQTSNRDRLAICVESYTPAGLSPSGADIELAKADAKSAIESIFPRLETDAVWVKHKLSDLPPQADIGCPQPPALYRTDLDFQPEGPLEAIGYRLANPSPYKMHVYIVPESEIARWGGLDGFRLSSEEYVCEEDSCLQVTAGLYLAADELVLTDMLEDYLSKGIGLEPAW